MTRISFIVPTFNRARYLGEALASILPQMDGGDELLVVDDGSTDGTAAVVAQMGDRVRYLRQDNAGKAVALNRGLAETTGRYVWICDDDDVLRHGAVALLVAALERTGAGFAFGRYTRFRDYAGERSDLGTGYWPDLSTGSLTRHILEDAFVMQNAALVRREAYQAVGPFAEAMLRSLDYEMFVRLAVAVPSTYVDRIVFDQRKHDGIRGPAAMLHAASASDNVWLDFDRRIFENLHANAPLSLFEGMAESAEPALRRRAALLQRMTIMARHACWSEFLADLQAAAAIPGKLDAGEIAIARRALSGKHGFASLLGTPHLGELQRIARDDSAARAIISQAFAGTLWRIRRGSSEERQVTLAAMHKVLGIVHSARLVASWRTAPSGPARLHEARQLAAETFLPAPGLPPVRPAPKTEAA